ncbi:uncharacterized protein LACBIDRAFT_322468 [Laccaria bicolor S238N-H82]|uniref:Predicted protein n=1 Tax=Laccaria bicolor (strain S238N-H82 / ATCC MYA-4686) TaxID=486041 RepID=B0CWE4_LACBS|nr:uncharacterized protein LACBIDRAFT_322468 [Laccaria bicolor S238N-H82]EDR13494.1 predicted protein [Laccaria bicolor S238N-H82]|eukprot:XP_001875992.1 predicted protein [Laccaria bicolor S238N-H82]
MWATATGKRPDCGSVQFGPMYIFSPVDWTCKHYRCGTNDRNYPDIVVLTAGSGTWTEEPKNGVSLDRAWIPNLQSALDQATLLQSNIPPLPRSLPRIVSQLADQMLEPAQNSRTLSELRQVGQHVTGTYTSAEICFFCLPGKCRFHGMFVIDKGIECPAAPTSLANGGMVMSMDMVLDMPYGINVTMDFDVNCRTGSLSLKLWIKFLPLPSNWTEPTTHLHRMCDWWCWHWCAEVAPCSPTLHRCNLPDVCGSLMVLEQLLWVVLGFWIGSSTRNARPLPQPHVMPGAGVNPCGFLFSPQDLCVRRHSSDSQEQVPVMERQIASIGDLHKWHELDKGSNEEHYLMRTTRGYNNRFPCSLFNDPWWWFIEFISQNLDHLLIDKCCFCDDGGGQAPGFLCCFGFNYLTQGWNAGAWPNVPQGANVSGIGVEHNIDSSQFVKMKLSAWEM